MGYRSEVQSIIYGPTPEVTKLIALEKLKPYSVLEAFGENITISRLDDGGDNETIIELKGDDWKWYDTYDDIIAWNNLMAQAKENPKLSVEFCRVGESSDDVEVETYGDNCRHYLRVYSHIDSDVPYYEEVDDPVPDEAVKETLEKVEEDLLAQTNRFCINGNCED
jgi:hypothetical protein